MISTRSSLHGGAYEHHIYVGLSQGHVSILVRGTLWTFIHAGPFALLPGIMSCLYQRFLINVLWTHQHTSSPSENGNRRAIRTGCVRHVRIGTDEVGSEKLYNMHCLCALLKTLPTTYTASSCQGRLGVPVIASPLSAQPRGADAAPFAATP